MTKQEISALISANIKENENGEITATQLATILSAIVGNLPTIVDFSDEKLSSGNLTEQEFFMLKNNCCIIRNDAWEYIKTSNMELVQQCVNSIGEDNISYVGCVYMTYADIETDLTISALSLICAYVNTYGDYKIGRVEI